MSSLILISVATVLFVAQVAGGVLTWKQRAAVRSTALSVARLRHELAMDAAVFVAKLTATEAATTWVRGHVDDDASRTVVDELGSDGYERYLIGLHKRYVGKA